MFVLPTRILFSWMLIQIPVLMMKVTLRRVESSLLLATLRRLRAQFWPLYSEDTKFNTYSSGPWNIRIFNNDDIWIFESKIFEYSYSVHFCITNIFVFVFGPEYDPEYIRIRIRVKTNIPNIFVFVFGSKKNIRYALSWENKLQVVICSLMSEVVKTLWNFK